MNSATRYREAMTSLTPDAQWRLRTLDAMTAAEAEQRPARAMWPRLAACAAGLVLLCAAGMFAWGQLFPPVSPGTLLTGPGYVSASNLPKLSISPILNEGMGAYGDDMGHLVVRSFEEQTSKNPTLDNTDSIKELPVYKNDPILQRERLNPVAYASGETLEEQLAAFYGEMAPHGGLVHPTLETTVNYNIYGSASTCFAWFEDDPSKSLTDRLLDYSFNRLGDESHVDEFGHRFSYCKRPAWPAKEGILYPIRTAEQAEADFRAGNYLGVDQPTNLDTAQILHIELVYLDQPYQTHIQPAYKITYTQDYWDVSLFIHRVEDPDAYTSVNFAYVPAVAEEYVEGMEPEFHFN